MNIDLTYFAKQDLDTARREGELLMAGTKEGLVALRYSDKVYTVTRQGMNAVELYRGARKGAISFLSGIYTVEVAV